MKVFDIFSKRQKKFRGEVPDVYQYEAIPEKLRIQIVYIWEDALGELYHYDRVFRSPAGASEVYKSIHDILCREHGMPRFSGPNDSDFVSVCDFFLRTEEVEKAIDVIDLSFRYIDKVVRDSPNKFRQRKISPDDAIAELNHRFRERGIGYQYQSGQVIRVDSQLAHSEVVKPALSLLSDPMYKGANDEFLSALKHYRKGRYKECLNECLKAFESCIKAICETRRWAYNDRDSISHLIGIICKHKLIPDSMQSHFSGLRSTLEAGVPTLRNKLSGHGQGSKEVTVPEYIAAYVLHLTASNILLLARANDELT